ncbi:MAG: hypothetical protein AAGK47_01270, partial [Bacteroidota bacterium]
MPNIFDFPLVSSSGTASLNKSSTDAAALLVSSSDFTNVGVVNTFASSNPALFKSPIPIKYCQEKLAVALNLNAYSLPLDYKLFT